MHKKQTNLKKKVFRTIKLHLTFKKILWKIRVLIKLKLKLKRQQIVREHNERLSVFVQFLRQVHLTQAFTESTSSYFETLYRVQRQIKFKNFLRQRKLLLLTTRFQRAKEQLFDYFLKRRRLLLKQSGQEAQLQWCSKVLANAYISKFVQLRVLGLFLSRMQILTALRYYEFRARGAKCPKKAQWYSSAVS